MRKFTSIIAALIILVSSSGTTVAFHYCGKSLRDIAVFGKASPCCERMEMPTDCCHDERIEIKSDTYQVVPQISNNGFIAVFVYQVAFPLLDFTIHFQNAQSNYLTFSPKSPPPDNPDIVVLVHSFLI